MDGGEHPAVMGPAVGTTTPLGVLAEAIAAIDAPSGVGPALQAVLRTVCTGLGWSAGIICLSDPNGALVPAASWPVGDEVRSVPAGSVELPIRSGSEDHGTLTLVRSEPRATSDDERLVLERIATLVGQVVLRDRLRREADEVTGAFAARAAHELRGLTGTLGVLTSAMLRRFDDLEAARKEQALATLAETAERLRAVVAGLFEIADIENGTRELNVEALHLAHTTRAVVDDVEWGDERQVVVDVDDSVVAADRAALTEILRSLLVNAFQHGGANISVTSARRDGTVELTVADDGPGITPAQRSLLFQPFSRGRDADPAGLGFSLARGRRLARMNGGDLVQQSDQRATRFVLTLLEASA